MFTLSDQLISLARDVSFLHSAMFFDEPEVICVARRRVSLAHGMSSVRYGVISNEWRRVSDELDSYSLRSAWYRGESPVLALRCAMSLYRSALRPKGSPIVTAHPGIVFGRPAIFTEWISLASLWLSVPVSRLAVATERLAIATGSPRVPS
jgi:hypothetical protein